MGELGRKLAGTGRSAALRILQRAYADEWFAHYNYQFAARTLRGHYSPAILDLLQRKTLRAFERANRLAARICELGAQPPAKLGDLLPAASNKPFKLPKSMSDVKGVLTAVLDAERTSLRTFDALCAAARGKDPVTERLAQDLLVEMAAGEEEIEKLIGDPAPRMDGK